MIQIYPNRSNNNNTAYNTIVAGIIIKILCKEKWGYEIFIVDTSYGCQVIDNIPPSQEILVWEGKSIKFDKPLTNNPKIGRFD